MGSVDGTGFDLSANFYNVINGEKRSSSRKRHGTNPSTMEQLPDVPIASSQDLDEAVRSSRAAFAEWSEVPVEKRKALVNAFADALEAHAEQFARLLTLEQGKPVSRVTPSPSRHKILANRTGWTSSLSPGERSK
jgi:acyl-CoA reductase-like NAD-dependent aldehyde dehydrogenase